MLLKQVKRELGRRERDVALSSGAALHVRPPGSSSSSDESLDRGRGRVHAAAPWNRHAAQRGERQGAKSPTTYQNIFPKSSAPESQSLKAVGWAGTTLPGNLLPKISLLT